MRAPGLVDTTMGRLIFNARIPQDLGFVDRIDPDNMRSSWRSTSWSARSSWARSSTSCIRRHGFTIATEVLDDIKALGYKYSTKRRYHRVRRAT